MKAFHAHSVPGQTSPIFCCVSTMLRNRVSPFALACLLLLLIASPARGRYTLEQVMSSPFPSQLVAAKNGGRLAWVFNKRGVRNVWVADAPEFRARQVTQYTDDDGLEMSSLRITPDGQTVIFARGSETNSAGEVRSEERRVGKECRTRGSPSQ